MSSHPSKPSSRFSTFNVFKFGAKSPQPPPPPPKDTSGSYYSYSNNRSLVSVNQSLSLSPDSCSLPSTPHSHSSDSQFSSRSYATPAPQMSSSPPASDTSSVKKGFKLPGFGKKSSSSQSSSPYGGKCNLSMKSLKLEDTPPPQEDDDDASISLPWNFQHHVHVDETMTGLPPSWSASLASAGFTSDEIAALQAARHARSSSSLHSLASLHPNPNCTPAGTCVVSQPNPRTSSLPRQFSTSTTHYPRPSGSFSDTSEGFSDSASGSFDMITPASHPQLYHHSASTGALPLRSPASQSSFSREKGGPQQRQRQSTYRVVNDTPIPGPSAGMSPPPAYATALSQALDFSPPDEDSEEEEDRRRTLRPGMLTSEPESYEGGLRTRPVSVVPPRLSLHEDILGDLSSWSESLFSAIPSEDAPSSSATSPSSSTTPSAPTPLPTRSPSSSSRRPPPPSRPIPSIVLEPNENHWEDRGGRNEGEGDGDGEATTPLFDEIMGIISRGEGEGSSSSSGSQDRSAPTSRRQSRLFSNGVTLTGAHHLDSSQDEGLLPDDASARTSSNSNRDSNASNRSTITVRDGEATIVQGAAWGKRAVAEVMVRGGGGTRFVQGEGEGRGQGVGGVGEGQEENGVGEKRRMRDSSLTIFGSGSGSGQGDSTRLRDSSATILGSGLGEKRDASPMRLRVGERESGATLLRVEPGEEGEEEESGFGFGVGEGEGVGEGVPRTPYSVLGVREGLGERSPVSSRYKRYSRSPRNSLLPSPSPSRSLFPPSHSGDSDSDSDSNSNSDSDEDNKPLATLRPNGADPRSRTSSASSAPAQRYPGWLYNVVRPLERFIDERVEPQRAFEELQEIAEGESGSVFSARVVRPTPSSTSRPSSPASLSPSPATFVAIKQIPIVPSGTPKISDLRRELSIMNGVSHPNVLVMDALYVDLTEDALWIKMELMERSLADVIALVECGVGVGEAVMARFAADVLNGLRYLQKRNIAHRDVRSDNMLLNGDGVLKLADFSNAVQVSPASPTCSDTVGVVYWQAPEVRSGSYDPLQIDTWSLGATVWEMAQAEPPFSDVQDPRQIGDRWPPLRDPDAYSRSLHDFLYSCSQPSSRRPKPDELLHMPFIESACTHSTIVELLSDCRAIEEKLHRRYSVASQGTIS